MMWWMQSPRIFAEGGGNGIVARKRRGGGAIYINPITWWMQSMASPLPPRPSAG